MKTLTFDGIKKDNVPCALNTSLLLELYYWDDGNCGDEYFSLSGQFQDVNIKHNT